ncbi:MAG: CusA/CzcA family heavy metal efflux RND transporter [Cyanobacteria bacterium]|nr:CusA/CzcA family heavy metal efflux RND transporter [Cyanobacteriota bacterium]
MENFLANLITKRLLICLVFGLCVLGGVFAFRNLPIDAFPDLTNNQVQVLTEAPGMAPVETEQLVTIPIESIMNGLPRVQQVRSISKFGLSVVTVVFEDDVNTYFARQLVNERLQAAKSRIPDGLNPELGPITTGMGEIYQYMVEGAGYTPTELKTLHDWDIKYQLRTVPGVNEVNTWGGFTQEYQVTLFPERLIQYGLTVQDVFEALENNNNNFSGGIIEHGSEQYVVRGLGRVNRLEDIGNILIEKKGEAPLAIKNVARVEYGKALRQGAVSKDGKGEVVTGIVMMLKGENSRAVIQRVKEKIKAIRKSLPEGVHIHPFYDQTHLVEQTIHTVQTNLVEGGILVIAVLLFMLGNLRAALIVAATIPLSMMFSFMGMKALGITANIMSLGAIDFGMIVDGSIVMVENTLRKLSHQEDPNLSTMAVIQDSLREMARPILFGVLIITVVYMPILALEGMEYKMFSPMVFTVSFALLGSLLIALVLVPVLCSFFLRGKVTEKESILIRKIRQPYLDLLEKGLHHRKQTVGIAVIAFMLTIASVPFLGSEFVPELDEGDILIEARNLPSISVPESLLVNNRIEQVIKELPEVKTVVARTGRPELATDPMGVYQTDVFVILKPRGKWRASVTKEALVEELSEELNKEVPGTNFSFTQPIAMRVDELVSGVRSDIAVKLFGDDMTVLTQKAAEIEEVVRTVEGQADLQTEKLSGSGQILITPDRAKMAAYGVNISNIQDVVETAIIGKPVSEVLEGKKRFTLRVKFPQGSQMDPGLIRNLLIETKTGPRIPIAQVAKVETGEGLEVVNREFGQRRIIVQMNVRGRDIGSFVQEGQRKIAEKVKLPPGYYIEWGGQFENQQRAMSRLMIVVPLSILIIFFLLMATFSTIKHALLVLINVPFALIGGVIALWLRGMYLSVPASVGFIALFGVAILNGLVLISTINKLREDGLDLHTAIMQGAETRLRPVLMTALVATLGFMPMALSTGAGAEVQKPLATVVIGGLVTSTLLTLVVLPVIYSWISQKEQNYSY